MVYIVVLLELEKVTRFQWRAVVTVYQARQSILGDDLLQALRQGMCRLGGHLV